MYEGTCSSIKVFVELLHDSMEWKVIKMSRFNCGVTTTEQWDFFSSHLSLKMINRTGGISLSRRLYINVPTFPESSTSGMAG